MPQQLLRSLKSIGSSSFHLLSIQPQTLAVLDSNKLQLNDGAVSHCLCHFICALEKSFYNRISGEQEPSDDLFLYFCPFPSLDFSISEVAIFSATSSTV